MQRVTGIASLLGRYDRFIFDVWGTLYDGAAAFPGAIEALRAIRDAGGRIVVLSNSPRVPSVVAERLARIGIGDDLFDGIVTSGGEVRSALERRVEAPFDGLGRRVLQTGSTRFPDTLPEPLYDSVTDVADADWLLATGPERETDTVEAYAAMLEAARARDLPMICANPDREVLHGGQRQICAGALSDSYRAAGGYSVEVGKPHPAVFQRCLSVLGAVAGDGVLVVGDNLATDIRGAAAAGLESLWLTDGVHGADVAAGATEALLATHGTAPTWVAPRLSA